MRGIIQISMHDIAEPSSHTFATGIPHMAVTAAALRELHRIHQQLADLQDRLERGPKQVRARTAAVAQAEEQLAKAQAEIKTARVALDQKQLQLKTGESKIIDLKV